MVLTFIRIKGERKIKMVMTSIVNKFVKTMHLEGERSKLSNRFLKLLLLVVFLNLFSFASFGIGCVLNEESGTLRVYADEKGDEMTCRDFERALKEASISSKEMVTKLKIEEGVKSIIYIDWTELPNVNEIDVPATTKNIHISFSVGSCKNLTKVEVAEGNKWYESRNGVVYKRDVTVETGKIERNLIWYPAGKKDTNFEILGNTSVIWYNAFLGAVNLKEITMPDSLKIICSGAFEGCNIEKVEYMGTREQFYYIAIPGYDADLGKAKIRCRDGEGKYIPKIKSSYLRWTLKLRDNGMVYLDEEE